MKANKRGDAMITVLCIMLLFMALSLTILLAASSSLGSSKQNAASTRCRLAAESFSEMMAEELMDKKNKNEYQQAVIKMLREDTSFEYCRTSDIETNLKWSYTVESNGKSSDKGSGIYPISEILPGYEISVNIYWGEKNLTLDEIQDELYSWPVDETDHTDVINPAKYSQKYIYTEVTCSKGSVSYTVRQKFLIMVDKKNSEGEPTDEETYEWAFN